MYEYGGRLYDAGTRWVHNDTTLAQNDTNGWCGWA
jgi:hypothetical protein